MLGYLIQVLLEKWFFILIHHYLLLTADQIKQKTGISDLITTSRFPGTTLDRIEIPFGDGHDLIDTPGIIHRHQMAHYLSAKTLKLASPQKEIKPKVYQLNEGQTLFLGALARFDYLAGPKQGVVAYLDNNLMIHRTKTQNAARRIWGSF